jgi:astacin
MRVARAPHDASHPDNDGRCDGARPIELIAARLPTVARTHPSWFILRSSVIYKPAFALFVLIAPAVAQIPQQIHTIEMDGREISYVIDGPYAVTQGDIILGKAPEIECWRIANERGKAGPTPKSLHQVFGSTGPQLWPNGIIYYAIGPSVANPQPIPDGIAQWNSRTPLQVLPFAGQPNYVVIVSESIVGAACESYIGMAGGVQFIPVSSGCTAGAVAHELGHAFGLWHEHVRLDRGGCVTVLYENIDKRFYSASYQIASLTASSGYYDFGSIMHYPWYGFSNNLRDTLETCPSESP